MQVIPAIDIIDGKCVRLSKGDYNEKTIYYSDPLEAAVLFERNGLKRLHLVDLDGAKKGSVVNWDILENICTHTSLEVDFSGGISTAEILSRVFDSGAALATIGSMAVNDETTCSEWIRSFGPYRFIIGADVKNGYIMTRGWEEKTPKTVFDLIETYSLYGITQFMCTDVNKDGMLGGPATELYKSIISAYPSIKLVASGGVSSIADLHELQKAGVFAAIVGKALYENKITFKELEAFT